MSFARRLRRRVRCQLCHRHSPRMIQLTFGAKVLGWACEPCEERFMEKIAAKLAETEPDEAASGLAKWRAAKAARVWPT